jgi:hypothetical protein
MSPSTSISLSSLKVFSVVSCSPRSHLRHKKCNPSFGGRRQDFPSNDKNINEFQPPRLHPAIVSWHIGSRTRVLQSWVFGHAGTECLQYLRCRDTNVFKTCYEVVHAAAAASACMQVIIFRFPRIYPFFELLPLL